MTLHFPTFLFNPEELRAELVGGVVTGGATVSGNLQVGEMSGGGLWSITQGGVTMTNREQMLAWRAMAAASKNGAAPIIVPLGDRLHLPVLSPGGTVPFSDTSVFSDGTTWAADQVVASLTTAAAKGATTLHFDYTAPKSLVGGEFFSPLHGGALSWRLHTVIQVVSGGVGSGDATVVDIWPPLRGALADDTPLNFDSPRLLCRVVGGLGALYNRLTRLGTADAQFMEAFPASLS